MKISDEQKAKIREMYYDNDSKTIADVVGLTPKQVAGYAHRQGLRHSNAVNAWQSRKNGQNASRATDKFTDEQRHIIAKLYPQRSSREIAELLNVGKSCVVNFAKKNNLHHTEECIQRLRHERTMKSIKARTAETYRKISVTRHRTYLSERLCLLSGKKKETKIIVSILPPKCRRRMTMLCTKFNYFRDEDTNKAVVYYDSETRRNSKAEQYAQEKYGIKFVSADG